MRRWVAFDVETTGLSPTRDTIRELAAVRFSLKDSHAGEVLHFTCDRRPEAGHDIREKLARLLRMLGDGGPLVAHNAPFDLAFLAEALRRAAAGSFVLRAYCTLRLAQKVLPDRPRYDLGSLRAALHLGATKAHEALCDAHSVASVFEALVLRAGVGDESALEALHGPPLVVRSRSAPFSSLTQPRDPVVHDAGGAGRGGAERRPDKDQPPKVSRCG